ncbi:MAG TPA: peptide chain release factor N(5)-glutamine methyltransferase [Polyangiaceae bacterium]|nr:peptide chain release factor N(5)-glutamine methyltransferase [Polyangiaceae bacterium]
MSSAAAHSHVWTIDDVLRWAAEDFRARGLPTARLDAELLLAHALSTTRVQLVVDSKRPLDAAELTRFRELVRRRRTHEPVAYLVGQREFYGRTFRVDRRVLVPRPDTEVLVDVAMDRTRHVSMAMRALDLCTGSGCVAITLARERPTSRVVATDAHLDALDVARDNARRLGAYNVALRPGDLFAAVDPTWRFDLVTANPPYVPTGEIGALPADVKDHEPRGALDGGEDGLAVVRRIVEGASAHLAAGGVLALEVGAGEADAVAALLRRHSFAEVTCRRDYGGIERVVSGVLEGR